MYIRTNIDDYRLPKYILKKQKTKKPYTFSV